MTRTIIIFGLLIAALSFLLTWLDYRFWMRDIGLEMYGLLIAVIFACLGIWIERQRQLRQPNKIIPERIKSHTDNPIKAFGLTRRETEILGMLRSGKSNKEIARDLGVSPNTVKTHLASVYEKLEVRNRTQAVTKAASISALELA